MTHYHMHVIPRNEEADQFGAMFYGHAHGDEPSESLEETHEKMRTYITGLLE
ncbi:hypothetical protein [Rossellomorea vietnamensis]|uniref:hypothetical protein n=1 Tax=Rossellomorea vietnamensis TaxID=218284 RepID=UPI003D9E27CA